MEHWPAPFVAGAVIVLVALWLERRLKAQIGCCAGCAGKAAGPAAGGMPL